MQMAERAQAAHKNVQCMNLFAKLIRFSNLAAANTRNNIDTENEIQIERESESEQVRKSAVHSQLNM